MAVPPGDVTHLFALHHLVPVDEIFEDLVERVSDVKVAVGVRWAVVEGEHLRVGALGDLLVDLVVRPPLLDGGLLRHAVGAHLKVRLWQEHGVPVDVVLLLALALLAALAALRGDDAE